MDHHPNRTRAAKYAVDPVAYKQGYDDGYQRRTSATFTTSVSCYQTGRVDGAIDRKAHGDSSDGDRREGDAKSAAFAVPA